MSLFDEILSWANSQLKGWQRDALRRLVRKPELDQRDIEDLYAMLKSENGLPDPQNRIPVPLASAHLPAEVGKTPKVILRGMRELRNVNRIVPGQKLTFEPDGMTVVYGCNASGKSGYSRVLKRACRARDTAETIHPDATNPEAAANVPEAVFDAERNGKPLEIKWTLDSGSPEELSTVSVFDGRCARAYLDAEQDVAYLPYGLDIVENLGQQVIPSIDRLLSAETATIDTDVSPFADLVGDTEVGKMITSLSAASDLNRIANLSSLKNTDIARLEELQRTLSEHDPGAMARSLRFSAQRIDGLVSRIDAAITWID